MAERRMFTKKVTDDDNFMQLSASAQALYLHLSMAADDDGFCNQVSISMFKAHASVQDLKALLEARYIYQFENGVIVIKHWRMANALRKDRYTPTAFKEELARLQVKDNGSYTLAPVGCQLVANGLPDGRQEVAVCLPQDRLGKDSIGKVSLGKDRIGEVRGDWGDEPPQEPPTEKREAVDYQEIVDAYNNTCKSLPRVTSLSEARRKAIRARLKTYTPDDLKRVFIKAEQSSFLKGANDRNWSANFDWLLKDSNIAKVLDGNYDNIRAPAAQKIQGGSRTAQQLDASYDMIARWAGGAEGVT